MSLRSWVNVSIIRWNQAEVSGLGCSWCVAGGGRTYMHQGKGCMFQSIHLVIICDFFCVLFCGRIRVSDDSNLLHDS